MTDSIYIWSTTPATNATVDSQINWQENQAPDTVNNSARQEMARVAEFRTDLTPTRTTAGTATAYTATAASGPTTLPDGFTVLMYAHATSVGPATLAVNSYGAYPLRPKSGVEHKAGEIILGTVLPVYWRALSSEWITVGTGFYVNQIGPQLLSASTFGLAVGSPVISLAPAPEPGFIRLTEATQAFSISGFPALAAKVASWGNPWGAVSGDNAYLPPAAGYFMRFAGTTSTIDTAGPRALGSIQGDQTAAHAHAFSGTTASDTHSHTVPDILTGRVQAGSADHVAPANSGTVATSSYTHSHAFSGTTNSTGTGTETRAKNVAFAVDILANVGAVTSGLVGSWGYSYAYSSTTTASDPGAGVFRFDNATLASVTKLYISETDGNGSSVAASLATWTGGTSLTRGRLRLVKVGTPATFAEFDITGTYTDNGAWDTFTLTPRANSGPFTDADKFNVSFIPAGDTATGVGTGTVTSVGLTMPADFAVASSPVTSAGTLAVTRTTQTANIVMAGPATGAAATPTYRALVVADIPALSYDAAGAAAAVTAATAATYAPLASPALTGNPTAPNQAAATNNTRIANTAYVDAAVAVLSAVVSGALVFKGAWDASAGTFPGAAVAQTGWFYKVSVAGTVGGQVFSVGDDIYAIVNNASTSVYAANWLIIQGTITAAEVASALGYTPLNPANNLSDVAAAATARTNLGAASLGSNTWTGLQYWTNTNNITALAGGGQASATALTTKVNRVSTVATANDSVKLPVSVAGMLIEITNGAANAMQVFGAGTDTINDIATATGVSQGAGVSTLYSCPVAGKWYATALVASGAGGASLTAANVFTTAGAVSTPAESFTGAWYAGGTATTTKPLVLIEPTGTTSTGWNTLGTGLGINAASGFTGPLIDLQIAGASKFLVYATGVVMPGTLTTGNLIATTISMSGGVNGVGINYYNYEISMGSSQKLAWYPGTVGSGSVDLAITRGAVGVASVESTSGNGGTFRHIPNRQASLAANQNDFVPTTKSKYQHYTASGAINITGISNSQIDGQEHVIYNVGSNAITLSHQSASSTAANRFLCLSGADIVLSANQAAMIWFDTTQTRWLVSKLN